MTVCPSCGTQNVDGVSFCVNCGAALTPGSPQPGAWRDSGSSGLGGPAAPEAERPASGGYTATAPPAAYPASTSSSYGTGGTAFGAPGQMNYAQWIDRVIAALIDGAIVGAVMTVLYIVLFTIGGIIGSVGGDVGGAIGSSICCLAFVLAPVSALLIGLYNKVYLLTTRGASIGQGVMNLQVVDAKGSLILTNTALIRLLAQIGLGIIPIGSILDILWPLWDEYRQTLHDKAVNTFVIKKG